MTTQEQDFKELLGNLDQERLRLVRDFVYFQLDEQRKAEILAKQGETIESSLAKRIPGKRSIKPKGGVKAP